MSNKSLLHERRGAVSLLTLNRPESANAINRELLEALRAIQHDFASDEETRVVVITGAGRNFCAGVDLAEALSGDSVAAGGRFEFDRIPQPVIAAINGAAQGGGLELALACDYRIASSISTFGLPEVQFGELPMLGGTARLARVVGASVAKRLILTGESIDATAALRIGLVDELVEPDQLLTHAMELANRIALNPGYAVRTGKRLIDLALDTDLDTALSREQAEATGMASDAEREVARAELAQRNPIYEKLFRKDR